MRRRPEGISPAALVKGNEERSWRGFGLSRTFNDFSFCRLFEELALRNYGVRSWSFSNGNFNHGECEGGVGR